MVQDASKTALAQSSPQSEEQESVGSTTEATVKLADRYKNRRFSVIPNVEVDPSEAAGIVRELRAAYNADKPRSKAWRIKQLMAFKRMMLEQREAWEAALMADLHKSKFDSFVTEFSLIMDEVNYFLKNLDKLMKPRKKGTAWLVWPAKSQTIYESLGVVFVMGTWNYPVQLTLVPVVGAIASGNCVLVKPGSLAHETSHVLARLLPKYLDNDCIKVVEGGRELSTALLRERFDKIFYTGSTYVGRIVARAAAEHLTPVVLELGGKSPCIIDKTADIQLAAKRISFSAFNNSGQLCIRADHLLVHEAVADKFVAELKKQIVKMYGIDPQNSEFYGRLINEGAYARLADIVEADRQYIVHGGDHDEADKYIAPTVFDFGSDWEAFRTSRAMEDELFGPLLPMVRYSKLTDAIDHVRGLPTGKPLGAYGFSSDPVFIKALKFRTTSGGLCINDASMHVINGNLPFGGVGNSGQGNYHREYSFKTFSHEKAVLQKSAWADQMAPMRVFQDARFPAYTSFRRRVVRTLASL